MFVMDACQRIAENGGGLLKRYTVFAQVRSRLGSAPSESVSHDREEYQTDEQIASSGNQPQLHRVGEGVQRFLVSRDFM